MRCNDKWWFAFNMLWNAVMTTEATVEWMLRLQPIPMMSKSKKPIRSIENPRYLKMKWNENKTLETVVSSNKKKTSFEWHLKWFTAIENLCIFHLIRQHIFSCIIWFCFICRIAKNKTTELIDAKEKRKRLEKINEKNWNCSNEVKMMCIQWRKV